MKQLEIKNYKKYDSKIFTKKLTKILTNIKKL